MMFGMQIGQGLDRVLDVIVEGSILPACGFAILGHEPDNAKRGRTIRQAPSIPQQMPT